jgi:hypothetical protein
MLIVDSTINLMKEYCHNWEHSSRDWLDHFDMRFTSTTASLTQRQAGKMVVSRD